MMRHKPSILAPALAALVLTLSFLAILPATAAAQQGGQPAAQAQSNDPQSGFVPVKDLPAQEKMPAAPLLIGAYAVVWAVLLVYVWTVWRRIQKVERDLHDLSARISAGPGRN